MPIEGWEDLRVYRTAATLEQFVPISTDTSELRFREINKPVLCSYPVHGIFH